MKAFNALCVGDGFSIEAQARVQATTKKNQLMEFPYFFYHLSVIGSFFLDET